MELWDLYDSQRNPLNKTHERGQPFAEGEFYVCAEIWVKNSEGNFLITKRHPDKKAGNLWEFSGGGTLAGETTKQSVKIWSVILKNKLKAPSLFAQLEHL